MRVRLKPIRKQVVVVTGASSGIGRETALQFAARGAKVVAAAQGKEGLQSLLREIEARGGVATTHVCDVADFEQVKAVADKAIREYGRIDTWVNNAAIILYALFEQTSPDEFRRILEVNVMGQVHGALAALPHMRRTGGALICVSSVESQVAWPLHSAYAASKHAVAGFVDSLRRELMHEQAPVSVTNIRPGSINTPLFTHARTKIGVKPQGPPPFYQASLVAEAILYAAEHPVRDFIVGGAAKAMLLGQKFSPRLMDRLLAQDRFGFQTQQTDERKPLNAPDNFYSAAASEDRSEGDFTPSARRYSFYDWLEMRGGGSKLVLAGAVGAAALVAARAYAAKTAHTSAHRWQAALDRR
jgi:NAD(P)-dependent dehydrogenase (short-subunit alcohol dehydrogenase family)